MKKIIILGSTGSIGENTLDIVRNNPDEFKVAGLTTKGNFNLLRKQIKEFRPEAVAICEGDKTFNIEGVKTYHGTEGPAELVRSVDADLVVSALVGAVGLVPTLEAINRGIDIALANKEVLVAAGSLVMELVKKKKINLIPIDSEHSALWQCINGREGNEISRYILTASGGPFYAKEIDLSKVTAEYALIHPRWQMGAKVTIDSATLMNKGFEVIEAHHLFGIPLEKIEVVIHPESIVHAMAEFIDGSIISHMHVPDMRIPIQYALSWPKRFKSGCKRLDLASVGALNFIKPDFKKYPAIELAYNAARTGGTMPAVLSACDEVCVSKFLNGEIKFTDIISIISRVIEKHNLIKNPNLEEIVGSDLWARKETLGEYRKNNQ